MFDEGKSHATECFCCHSCILELWSARSLCHVNLAWMLLWSKRCATDARGLKSLIFVSECSTDQDQENGKYLNLSPAQNYCQIHWDDWDDLLGKYIESCWGTGDRHFVLWLSPISWHTVLAQNHIYWDRYSSVIATNDHLLNICYWCPATLAPSTGLATTDLKASSLWLLSSQNQVGGRRAF